MSIKLALSHEKEIRFSDFPSKGKIGQTCWRSTVEDVENFVEVVDNFLYLNLYPLLWKPILPGREPWKALKIHMPGKSNGDDFLKGIQSV